MRLNCDWSATTQCSSSVISLCNEAWERIFDAIREQLQVHHAVDAESSRFMASATSEISEADCAYIGVKPLK